MPPGVRAINGRYYWQPTSKDEIARRKAAGLPLSEALGDDLKAAWKNWSKLQASVPADPGTLAQILARFMEQEIPRIKPSGKPKYAPRSQKDYRRDCLVLLRLFGNRRYAKDQVEAAKGKTLRRMDLQQWVDETKTPPTTNHQLAVLSVAFEHAIGWGYTEHNPCLGVRRADTPPRQRDVKPWEIQAILTAAEGKALPGRRGGEMMALMVRIADITGASGQDCRELRREHITADGLLITRGKTGSRRLSEWSPALRAIIDEALAIGPELRGTVFCNRSGRPYTEDAFQTQWGRTMARARALAKEAGLPQLVNLHFHDIRKKAGNDAAERGATMHEFLGNTQAVARKHYLTRPVRTKPTR